MNKKGFTLTEVLVVIIILSAIILIAYPAVNLVLTGSKESVNKITLKSINDSADMFASDVFICDAQGEILNILTNELSYVNINNCADARAQLEEGIVINMNTLRDHDYIEKAVKCSGDIIVSTKNNKLSNIKIDISDIKCEK